MEEEIEALSKEVTEMRTMMSEMAGLMSNLNQRLEVIESNVQKPPPTKEEVIAYMEEHGVGWDMAEAELLKGD